MQGDFQSQVNVAQAPAVIGDYCDKNPRYSFDAGPGGLVAGASGCLVGHFGWATSPFDGNGTPSVVSNTGSGPVSGVVHREQQGLIVNYLASSGLTVQPGFGLTLMTGGGFWAYNSGSGQALPGMKAYANYADGAVTFAATGAPGTASATGSIAAGAGKTWTGSIADALMTVTAITGSLVIGGVISGSGVASGTQVVSQVLPLISGEALLGIGRYNVSIPEQTVASTTITETWGVFTAASALSGTFGIGDTLSGPGGSSDPVSAGTVITQLGTGTGGLGTYIVNLTQTSSSATVTAGTTVETKWYARSSGLTGELVKMSDQPLG